MKFDLSKVQTAVNADAVKVGSKGYLANSLSVLRSYVEDEKKQWTITKTDEDGFYAKGNTAYQYFYPVEEKTSNRESLHSETNAEHIEMSKDELREALEKRFGSEKKVLEYCADTTVEFVKRASEMAEELQKFIKEHREVSMVGDFSIVMGVRAVGSQGFVMSTGSTSDIMKNILEITKSTHKYLG